MFESGIEDHHSAGVQMTLKQREEACQVNKDEYSKVDEKELNARMNARMRVNESEAVRMDMSFNASR